MSYDQHKAAANKVKIQAIRSLISKYGADAAKQAEPLIDAAIADKNNEYANKLDNQNRQELVGICSMVILIVKRYAGCVVGNRRIQP